MILTKKGSTSSNIHLLAIVTVILMVTRIVVETIENGIPEDSKYSIAWQEIPDYTSEEIKKFYVVPKRKKSEQKTDEAKAKEVSQKDLSSIKLSKKESDKKDKKEKLEPEQKRFELGKFLKGNQKKKPIFLLITNDTNLLCKEFRKYVLSNERIVKKIDSDFYPIKISLDKKLTESQWTLYKNTNPSTFIPVILIKDSKGDYIHRLPGSTDTIGLMAFLDEALTKIEQKANPDKNSINKWDPHHILKRQK